MKKTLAAAFLLSAFAAAANANTGIFFGSGHTITLGKSEQVQLVSEDVTIKPNCGRYHANGFSRLPLQVRLEEPDRKAVEDSGRVFRWIVTCSEAKEAPNATDLVLDYGFIARDDKTPTMFASSPTTARRSSLGCFSGIWHLIPQKRKFFMSAYHLGMSQALSSTRKDFATQEALPSP